MAEERKARADDGVADRWKARKTKELGLQRRLRRARAGETVFFGTPAERAAGCWRTRIYARGSHTQGACLRDSERLTVLAWQDLGRGLLLSENPHLRARFQIVHRRRDERRKVLAWRGRALSGYRLPSDDLGRGLLLSENPHLRARFQIVHRRRDERRKVLAWRGRALSGYRLPSDEATVADSPADVRDLALLALQQFAFGSGLCRFFQGTSDLKIPRTYDW
ncbi:hypothetical protein MRX96_035029 [Rhipicephalus microplus]